MGPEFSSQLIMLMGFFRKVIICRYPLDPEGPQVPPVDYGDKLLTQPKWCTPVPPHGRFYSAVDTCHAH